MLKLLKYEIRKTMLSKLLLLVVTAMAELYYLYGIFAKKDDAIAIGAAFLVVVCLIGVFYIGIDTLLVFHKDLNTKQSYMLFMMPRNGYQILGAKVLENMLSLALTGVFFGLLASADISLGIRQIGGVQAFLQILNSGVFGVALDFRFSDAMLIFAQILSEWLQTIGTGDLAIVLCSSVLSGKRFSGFLSFLLFFLLSILINSGLNQIPAPTTGYYTETICRIIYALGATAILYLITGWFMDHKLNV